MKILEITNYTAGGCGVGARAIKEAVFLSKIGHKVQIFSSNLIKGSADTCTKEDKIGNVKIKRFPALRLGGESYMFWSFRKEALKFNPDVIIVHAYRHMHNIQALKIAKKLKCRIFLVTHAPFAREQSRTGFQSLMVSIYDKLIGKKAINNFTKVIAITKWETPYLKSLGLKDSKIEYVPNGIAEEFFKPIKLISKPIKKIAYWGRISRIKQLGTVSEALAFRIEQDWEFKLRGPADKDYLEELNELIKEKGLEDKESIEPSHYNSSQQIKGLDDAQIFVLPSISEGMPQTLIEAMSRGRIVIASDNRAAKEIIKDCKNGFLFKNGDAKDLSRVLGSIKKLSQKEINLMQKNARKTAEQFRWSKIINNLNKLISN